MVLDSDSADFGRIINLTWPFSLTGGQGCPSLAGPEGQACHSESRRPKSRTMKATWATSEVSSLLNLATVHTTLEFSTRRTVATSAVAENLQHGRVLLNTDWY